MFGGCVLQPTIGVSMHTKWAPLCADFSRFSRMMQEILKNEN